MDKRLTIEDLQWLRRIRSPGNTAANAALDAPPDSIGHKLFQQANVFGIALDEGIARMGIIGLFCPAILAEIIQPNDFMVGVEQFLNEITANKTG